jgi:hypothetical protein
LTGLAVIGPQFDATRVCDPIDGECVVPATQRIVTRNMFVAPDLGCGSGSEQPVVHVTGGEQVRQCLTLCNETGSTISRVTLIINKHPEFENLAVNIPDGTCSTASRLVTGTQKPVEEFTSFFCASTGDIPGCVPPDEAYANQTTGGAAGEPALPLFTDLQEAFLIGSGQARAPAAGPWALAALGAGLLLAGLRRRCRAPRA